MKLLMITLIVLNSFFLNLNSATNNFQENLFFKHRSRFLSKKVLNVLKSNQTIDIDLKNAEGKTVLMRAFIENCDYELLDHLIFVYGADLNVQDNGGKTAIMHAFESGYYFYLTDLFYKKLLNQKLDHIDFSLRDNKNQTLFDLAQEELKIHGDRDDVKMGYMFKLTQFIEDLKSYQQKFYSQKLFEVTKLKNPENPRNNIFYEIDSPRANLTKYNVEDDLTEEQRNSFAVPLYEPNKIHDLIGEYCN